MNFGCEAFISNVTGHDCLYQKCHAFLFDYNSYCTFDEYVLHNDRIFALFMIVFILMFIYFFYIMPRWREMKNE